MHSEAAELANLINRELRAWCEALGLGFRLRFQLTLTLTLTLTEP